MLTITHNAGFFSCCNIKLRNILHYFNSNKCLPETVDSSAQFKLYKPVGFNKDITYHFFKYMDSPSILYDSDIVLRNDDKEDQFSDYTQLNLKRVAPLLDRYFTPSQKIIDTRNQLLHKYNINTEKCIAVYYRGTDKHRETKLGDYEQYSTMIHKLLSDNTDCKLLIQSDSRDFLTFIVEKYRSAIIIKENRSSTLKMGIHNENTGNMNYKDIVYFFATVLIMSNCKHIICSSGNCSLWTMFYRGHTENVHQYLNDGFLYSD